MRLQGKVNNMPVVILVDSGSTHNFVDQSMVKRGGLYTRIVIGISAIVANGDIMWVKELCPNV